MINEQEEHWLFLIRTEDRPGAAAAIAVAFSGRGLQIESFIGYGDPAYSAGRNEGDIAIVFRAFRPRMEMVRRILQRLELIRSVDAYDYDTDRRLIKTATVRLRPGFDLEAQCAGKEIKAFPISETSTECIVVLAGRPFSVDAIVKHCTDTGYTLSAVFSILVTSGE